MKRKQILIALLSVVGLSLLLALWDGTLQGFSGWWTYCVVMLFIIAIGIGIWFWVVRGEGPRWLITAIIVAFLLRLGVGVLLKNLLPIVGYDTYIQQAGHIYRDSYKRDEEAWSLANSDRTLLEAFTDPSRSDQYGGLLFASAFLYRVSAGQQHLPILTVVLTASASSLALLFGWGFADRRFGKKVSKIAVWVMAIFPDAVLLGASQMREPFLIAGFSGVLFGYSKVKEGNFGKGTATILGSLLILLLPFSPPTALIVVLIVALAWIWEGEWGPSRNWLWLIPIVLIGLGSAVYAARAWVGIGELEGSPLQVILNWFSNAGADWRLNELIAESGWIDTIFESTPSWSHLPLVVGYGLVQPFLPAALTSPGAAIWQVIGIFRSLGWFVILPFLLYAPIATIRKQGLRDLVSYLALLVWGTALLASYRAPGLPWDNPRYRTVFLVIHAVVAAWLWVETRKSQDPWLGRAAILVAGPTLLFTQWYAGRYVNVPRFSFSLTVVFSILFIFAFFSGLLIWDFRRSRNSSG